MAAILKEDEQMALPSEKSSHNMMSFYMCLLRISNFECIASLTFRDLLYTMVCLDTFRWKIVCQFYHIK